MAKNSAKLSNKALIQKENFIGKKHKSFTYLVDEKTLMKKKKQPKCLRNHSHEKIDFTSQIGIEYFFRKVCQKGSLFREETANPPRCGFYHHFDPYLKVSIISSEVFCFLIIVVSSVGLFLTTFHGQYFISITHRHVLALESQFLRLLVCSRPPAAHKVPGVTGGGEMCFNGASAGHPLKGARP